MWGGENFDIVRVKGGADERERKYSGKESQQERERGQVCVDDGQYSVR